MKKLYARLDFEMDIRGHADPDYGWVEPDGYLEFENLLTFSNLPDRNKVALFMTLLCNGVDQLVAEVNKADEEAKAKSAIEDATKQKGK